MSRERSKRRERSDSREKKRRSRSRDAERRRSRSREGESRRKRSQSRDGGRKRRPSLEARLERSSSRERRKREKRSSSKDRGRGGGRGGGEKKGEKDFSGIKESDRYGLKTKEAPPGVLTGANAGEPEVPKEGVNLGLSGALTEDTNTFNGVVIKYSEPPEARVPKRRWRFYVFKGEETLPTLHLHRQSAYLMGRDRKVCDLSIDHPSASKQHAVFQYRLVGKKREDGTEMNKVLPYVIDLGSSNGTYLNNTRLLNTILL